MTAYNVQESENRFKLAHSTYHKTALSAWGEKVARDGQSRICLSR